MGFIEKYFIEPIINRTGYNPVNTISYAVLAIFLIYIVYRLFKKEGIKFDYNLVNGAISFVLFGSTVRVITDSIDSGVFSPISPLHSLILSSHIYDYGFLTASPGIYVVVSSIFVASVLFLNRFGKMNLLKYFGLALFFFHLILLIPFFLLSALPLLVFSALLTLIPYVLSRNRLGEYSLGVFAHALDGSATFISIEFAKRFTGVSYFEQHVLANTINSLFGSYFFFYLFKVLVSFLILNYMRADKSSSDEEKSLIFLIVVITGLAPGVRDLLRVLVGA